jgi:type VI secretion system ImpC/EvpB family protein
MGNEVTIAGASATAVEQSATAVEPGGSLRESVLAGRFFGERHAGPAAELATFLHGGLDAASALQAWFGEALSGLLAAGALRAALDRDITEIDAAMSEQLDAVLHAPRFLNLEGRWRGLAWLISGIEPGRRIKVRLLPIAWVELCRDLERALEFDQSVTFRRIYEEEFGMAGGEPYGLMVIDRAVRHRAAPGATTDDVGAMAQLSAVAAAAFMPVVLSLDPRALEVDEFSDLDGRSQSRGRLSL